MRRKKEGRAWDEASEKPTTITLSACVKGYLNIRICSHPCHSPISPFMFIFPVPGGLYIDYSVLLIYCIQRIISQEGNNDTLNLEHFQPMYINNWYRSSAYTLIRGGATGSKGYKLGRT